MAVWWPGTLEVPARQIHCMRRIRVIPGGRRTGPSVVRDRRVGGNAGGSWQGRFDVVEFYTEESAGKLSLGLMKNGMVSAGRSAVSPELLEV